MRILIATPYPTQAIRGNSTTARRWQRLLTELGHDVVVARTLDGQECDALVALHARRSHPAVARFRQLESRAPLIVALTGTDLYEDLPHSADARRSLELADRLVVLHDRAAEDLPAELREKVRPILQSAVPPDDPPEVDPDLFEVCVIGNLRRVKDPFRAALAARLAPATSRLRVLQVGEALDPGDDAAAEREQRDNSRYRWLGPLPEREARAVLARSRAMVVSSELEGGANVVSEAAVCGVPVLASDIPGNRGLLGDDHPGYFAVHDTRALAALLARAENDPEFLARLRATSERLAARVTPELERASWARLLAELGPAAHRA